ncbi:hypothetical protein [Nocardia harenae]|uniref:hypothetical protein n=1 Tax=Nocardia harenae TaxID=358707 RepID=UPI000A95685E|nr:hypothetical protein [Nocardia harenae]
MARRKAKKTAGDRERIQQLHDGDRAMLAALATFGDPLAVAHAIVSSPTGMHRYLSLAPAVRVALRAAAQQRRRPKPCGGMTELVDLARSRAGALAAMEDAVPIDPRIDAVAVFKGRPYRVFPGLLERPIASLRTAELVSDAIDSVLRSDLGFGVGDYVELCLSHTSRVVAGLVAAWPDDPLPQVGDPPSVTTAEITAAAAAAEFWRLSEDSNDYHRTALVWATKAPGQLRVDTGQGMAGTCFGTTLAVEGAGNTVLALPLPYIAESWDYAVGVLAQRAAGRPECEREWLAVARNEATRLLLAMPDAPMTRIVHGEAGPALLMMFGDRHILAFAVAAGITSCDLRPAEEALAAVTAGTSVRSHSGLFDIHADAEIVRVVIAAPVGAAMLMTDQNTALVTLSALQWMTSTSTNADQLWAYFHEDLVGNRSLPIFGWDAADSWQFWKANGQAVHRAGIPPTAVAMAPHQVGTEECLAAAKRGPLEMALLRLGLPSSRDLAGYDDGKPARFLTPDHTLWAMATLEPLQPHTGTILAELLDGDIPLELEEFAFHLLGTVCRVALHNPAAVSAALRECDLNECVVRLRFDADINEPLVLGDAEEVIELLWNADLPQAGVEEPDFIQERLGQLFTKRLNQKSEAGQAVSVLNDVWSTVPRMLMISAAAPPQRAQNLPQPPSIPEWSISQANRSLGAHLSNSGCTVGDRNRAESRILELEVVVPWIKRQISAQFDRFDPAAVVRRAAVELEAISSARHKERHQRKNHQYLPTSVASVGNLDVANDTDTRLGRHWAVCAALLELGLAASPGGTQDPDDIEWSHLMAAAGLFVDSTVRCDALLHELSNDRTRISDSYEITIESDSETSSAVDTKAFNNARLRHARRQLGDDVAHDSGPDPEQILARIDPAMLREIGCTATALLSVCSALASWPVTDAMPVAEASLAEICDHVATLYDLDDDAQVRAAVKELTLTREGLAAETVQPWKGRSRDQRLMTRPIVALNEGTLLILPWNAGTSGLILAGYLSDGLLPWPPSRLDRYRELRKALDQVRLLRTRVLEDQVDAELRRLGLVVRSRIKPQHAGTIGMSSLPGEVDHIAVNTETGELWVIDDKDLAEAYTPAEIARVVDQFFRRDKGEIPKLQAKAEAIQANLVAVAAALGVPTPRSVCPLFVSRTPLAAAYTPSPTVEFTTLGDLQHVVAASRFTN